MANVRVSLRESDRLPATSKVCGATQDSCSALWRGRATLLTALIASAAFFSLGGCKDKGGNQALPDSAPTIRVGEVGSLTGSEATFGISTHNGLALAIKEINEQGGVLGKKIELSTLDNQGKPEEAATAVNRLINRDKIIAVIGEVASGRSLAMAPIAQSNKLPMISPSSTNPKVTEQGDYIFRVCFIDDFQGEVMARFALENLRATRVAVLRDVKNDYSVGLSAYFSEYFQKKGGTIVADQGYSGGDTDFKAQLTAIRSKTPEAIFVPGFYTDVGLIARQARELGISVPLIGGDGWESPKLLEIGGDALEGAYFSTHYSPDDESPAVQNFVSKYRREYKAVPDALAANGYDAGYVLVDAIKRAGTTESSKLRDAIANTKNFPAVTGRISIDAKRNAVKSAVILKIRGGQYVYDTTIAPS